MSHRAIAPPNAPSAVGPYSPGIAFDGGKLVFTSGQVPLDPQTGQFVKGGIPEQT
ncbi:MAG: hypothetical protein HY304_08115, partial [candidate division Zixibacteria bacterium]|nr:hypothetical protein [candidate division Zixibacteria bacterium]